jgi:hypothetical protein
MKYANSILTVTLICNLTWLIYNYLSTMKIPLMLDIAILIQISVDLL